MFLCFVPALSLYEFLGHWVKVLGVSPLEKFDSIKAVYKRKHKDAEKQGDEAAMERVQHTLARKLVFKSYG